MAERKKRATVRETKSKKIKTAKKSVKRAASRKSGRTSKKITAKKSVKRGVGRKSRGTSKKVIPGTSKKRVSRPKRVTSQKQQMVPVVEGEIIDVIDEPMPGMVRTTEIEATRVTLPGSDDGNEE